MSTQNLYSLENSNLKASFNTLGAELISLVNKKDNQELIWQGAEGVWSRHNPILFPNVGKTYENVFLIDGETFPTSQHGFARGLDYSVTSQDDNSITFTLKDNKETLKIFPFKFTFNITYTLKDKSLNVEWEVINDDDKELSFTIGAHPAFNTWPAKRDYYLYFPGKDKLTYKLLNPESGCVESKEFELKLDNHKLQLSDELFAKDALIIDDYQISDCIIQDYNGNNVVGVKSEDFPNYGIWSSGSAPYVCLEPWMGRADDVGFKDELKNKPNVNKLKSKASFKKDYEIDVY